MASQMSKFKSLLKYRLAFGKIKHKINNSNVLKRNKKRINLFDLMVFKTLFRYPFSINHIVTTI